MFNAWQALADDIMTFLIARGVRPTPHRYAVVSYLADHGALDGHSAGIEIIDSGTNVNRAIVRRTVDVLVREGVVEQHKSTDGMRYILRPPEAWGTSEGVGVDQPGDQHLAAAG